MKTSQTLIISILLLSILFITACTTTELEPVTTLEELSERAQSIDRFHYEYVLNFVYTAGNRTHPMYLTRNNGITKTKVLADYDQSGNEIGIVYTWIFTGNESKYCEEYKNERVTCSTNNINSKDAINLHEYTNYYDYEFIKQFETKGQATKKTNCQKFELFTADSQLQHGGPIVLTTDEEIYELFDRYDNRSICIDDRTGQIVNAKHTLITDFDNGTRRVEIIENLQTVDYSKGPKSEMNFLFPFIVTSSIYDEDMQTISFEYIGLETKNQELYYTHAEGLEETINLDVLEGETNKVKFPFQEITSTPKLCKDPTKQECYELNIEFPSNN